MIIKWALQVIAEALLATVVLVLCMCLQPLVGLPIWSGPLFILPAMFYLKWQLKDRGSVWPFILFSVLLCPVLFVTEFLPMRLVPTAMIVGTCLIIYIIPLDNQNRQTTSPTKPITPSVSKNTLNLKRGGWQENSSG